MLISGFISNYKYFEDSRKSEHFYEITCCPDVNEEICYYARGESGKPVPFGTDAIVDTELNTVRIGNFKFQIEGTFQKRLNIVNYQGFVLDCLDSDIGIYNLDNEIYLFGSACLDLPIGSNVTLFNLHLVKVNDLSWIFKLTGKSFKKSSHILVYCPAFSSYLEGTETVSYDNFITTRSNIFALIYANTWLKNKFDFESPCFNELDELSACLFQKEINRQGGQFIGHCEKCCFSDNFFEYSDTKIIKTAKNVKELFHQINDSIRKNSSYNNQIFSGTTVLRNEIVQGIIARKTQNLYNLTSGEKTIQIYCEDSNFDPSDGSTIMIFDAHVIVEIYPKLRIPDSWIVKAYLWISPETKVWSPNGFSRSFGFNFTYPPGFILCQIVKKYLILKDFNNIQYDTAVIHVESEKGRHYFLLNPTEKYYGIINTSDCDNEAIISIGHLIHESCFTEASSDKYFLPPSEIIPTLSCTLKFDEKRGPLQVHVNDIPHLSLIKSLRFFSIKLRTYSISSLYLKLICSKCKSQISSGRCLGHFDDFQPILIISAVIEAADMNGSPCSILVDQFSLFSKLYKLDKLFKTRIINLLTAAGFIKLESEHFSFKEFFKPQTATDTLAYFIVNSLPRVSEIVHCTFDTSNSILKPINLEICDPKLEIINLLKLF